MLKWLWLLAASILADIEGISMILIWNLGLSERIAMLILLILQVTLFFSLCYFMNEKSIGTRRILCGMEACEMGCLECGEYLSNPNEWVCDKCTEKFMIPFNKLSEEEKKKVLNRIERVRKSGE